MSTSRPFSIAALAAVASLLAGCGSAQQPTSAERRPAAVTTADGTPVAGSALVRGAAQHGLPSVVSVGVTVAGETTIGNGTLMAAGAVVTDSFLVSGAGGAPKSGITVRDAKGREFSAVVDGVDRVTRLAVLRVRQLATAPVAKGAPAPALGSAAASLGYLSAGRPSVRAGAVVSTGRSVRLDGIAEVGLFEADGSLGTTGIGGPVVDGQGRVLGITTRAIAAKVPGATVAVPYAAAKRVAAALSDSGRVRRAFLGAETVEVTPARAEALRLRTSKGLILRSTAPGSPAALAMFKAPTSSTTVGGKTIPTGGDVIVAFGGKPIAASEDLDTQLLGRKPGDRVAIKVIRGDRSVNVPVTLGER